MLLESPPDLCTDTQSQADQHEDCGSLKKCLTVLWVQAVLVVAANLLMTSGKIGSQCAHAAVGLYKVMMANRVPWYPAFEVSLCQDFSSLKLRLVLSFLKLQVT